MLGLDHHAVRPEAFGERGPVHPTQTDAEARDALDLLLDPNQADLLVVEHHHDDRQTLAHRGLQLRHRHQKTAVAGEGHHRSVRPRQAGGQCARNGVTHGTQAVGGKELAGTVGKPLLHHQKPACTGVAGRDGVARKDRARDLHGPVRRQARGRDVQCVGDVVAKAGRGRLAPARALRRKLGETAKQRPEIAHHLGREGNEGVERGHAGERQHRNRIRPGFGLQLDAVETDGDDEVRPRHQVSLDEPSDDAPRPERVVFRNRALDLGGGQDRGAEPFGEGHQPVRCSVPQHTQPREDDGPRRAAKHGERNVETGRFGLDRYPFAQQRGAPGDVGRFGPGLVRGHVDVDRTGGRRHRGTQSPAYLGPHRPGVKRRLPLRDRRVDLLVIEDLAKPGLVDTARILVRQRDQGCAVQPGMGDAVDHVRGARSASRGTDAGAARDLAPGRSQHRARHFLLHQDIAHVPRPRGVHQLDGLAARVSDDEGGAALQEGVGQDLDGAAHRTDFS